jgi:flagellar basal body P-ring formation protein FlgA
MRPGPWRALAVTALLLWAVHAHAEPGYAEAVRLFVDERLQMPGNADIEVSVGEPDPRLVLAPCKRTEPFVPGGAKLLGRTSLGVRCLEGANWTIYLPVRIRMFMDIMVAARPLARGQTVSSADVRAERVDIAPLRGNAILASDWVEGRSATRIIAPGEPVRRDWLKAPAVLVAGDTVQVVAVGTGFAAQTSGKALTGAAEGESVQVSVSGGRVLTGVARAPHSVEIR